MAEVEHLLAGACKIKLASLVHELIDHDVIRGVPLQFDCIVWNGKRYRHIFCRLPIPRLKCVLNWEKGVGLTLM
jgi:hypothetical protein